MADINWGILQPTGGDIKTAQPQAQGAPAPPSPSPTANMNLDQATNSIHEQQQMGLLKAENARAEQLQPGLLQQQTDAHAKAMADQASMQYGVKVRTATSQAYTQASQTGGPVVGLNAAYDTAAKMGDVDTATKGYAEVAKLKQQIKEGNVSDVMTQGDQAHGIMKQAQMTNQSPLAVYANAYPQMKKINPDLPDPSKFRDNAQFEDTFIKPSLATAMPFKQAAGASATANKGSTLADAQDDIEESHLKLKQAVSAYGADSSQAKEAAQNLQNAQANATRVARGGEGGTLGGISNWWKTPGQASTDDLINQDSQQPGAAPAVPGTPTVAPKAAPLPAIQDIQAELARRAQQAQQPGQK